MIIWVESLVFRALNVRFIFDLICISNLELHIIGLTSFSENKLPYFVRARKYGIPSPMACFIIDTNILASTFTAVLLFVKILTALLLFP